MSLVFRALVGSHWRVASLLVCSLLLIPGCGNNPRGKKKSASNSNSATQTAGAGDKVVATTGDSLVTNVFDMLGGVADAESIQAAVQQLNHFHDANKDLWGKLHPRYEQPEMIAMIGADAIQLRARAATFDVRDAFFLRDVLFLQDVVQSLRRRLDESDLAFAQRLFAWTTRFVHIIPDGKTPSALPRDICLRGTGSARERIWVFLELLRQANITGCALGLPHADDTRPWLCGVLDQNEIYLFEPRLGLVLTKSDGTIATFKELRAQPTLLLDLLTDIKSDASLLNSLRLAPDMPYPLDTNLWANAIILFLVEGEMLSPRMAILQESRGNRIETTMFSEGGAPLIQPRARLAFDDTVLAKSGEKVRAGLENASLQGWRFPRQTRGEFFRPGMAQQIGQGINFFWRAPQSPRQLQLHGDHAEAIKRFVQLDRGDLSVIVPASMRDQVSMRRKDHSSESLVEILNEQTKPFFPDPQVRRDYVSWLQQDLFYFVGLSMMSQPKPQPNVARSWLERYLRQYATPTLSEGSMLDWLGFCAALANSGAKPSPARRVWTLLDDSARSVIQESLNKQQGAVAELQEIQKLREELDALREEVYDRDATDEQRANIANLEKALQTRASRMESAVSLAARTREQLVASLNQVLIRADFYDRAHFEALTKSDRRAPQSERLTALLQRPMLTEKDVLERNRLLLDAAFPWSITRAANRWEGAVIRQLAQAYRDLGQKDQALALLRGEHTLVDSLHRAGMIAQARQWQSR